MVVVLYKSMYCMYHIYWMLYILFDDIFNLPLYTSTNKQDGTMIRTHGAVRRGAGSAWHPASNMLTLFVFFSANWGSNIKIELKLIRSQLMLWKIYIVINSFVFLVILNVMKSSLNATFMKPFYVTLWWRHCGGCDELYSDASEGEVSVAGDVVEEGGVAATR